jgi:VanZ family protein
MTRYGDGPASGAHDHLLKWGPVALWAAVLVLLSSVPGTDLPPLPGQSDKLLHAAVYAILGALWLRGLRLTWPCWGRARAVLIAAILSALFGISDEFHQAFTPRRTPDWHDLLADAIGGLIGAWILTLVLARRRDSSKSDAAL